MIAHILSIGNELLIGDTVNTNAAWMGALLTQLGVRVRKVSVVGDDRADILGAIEDAVSSADLLLITGGLGPTHDDVTKHVLAERAGCGFRLDGDVLAFVQKMFADRGLPFTPSNRDQAMVPEVAETLFNRKGTAPGLWLRLGGCEVAAMPGVPSEMKHVMETHVVPRVLERLDGHSAYTVHYLHTFGIGESQLSDEVIGDVSKFLGDSLTLAFLPGTGNVTLRVSSFAESKAEAESLAEPLLAHIRSRAAGHIFSEEPLATPATALIGLLGRLHLKIATAESCTGGLLAGALTDVPGSSSVFDGGIVSYSNEVKIKDLQVPPEVLDAHGAVSAQTAAAMAKGVALRYGADIGVSTTGIAGPGGATPDKPVGTVWFGFWSKDGVHFAALARLFRDREGNRERSVGIALDIVRRQIVGIERLPFDMERVSF